MSGGLPDDQAQLVHEQLSSVTTLRVFPEILETALFAIFTILICVSTGVLVSKGLRDWPNRVMLAFTLCMYTFSTLTWAVDIKIMWNELNVFLPGLLSPTTEVSEDIGSTLHALDGAWEFTFGIFSQLNILFSDAVVLWRACVVWNRHKGVIGASVLILTCLLGVYISYVLSTSARYLPSAPNLLLPLSKDVTISDIGAAFFSLSAFANVWATSMVACKAWIHRRDIRRYLQSRTAQSAVEHIFTLLVESGIVYSISMVLLMLTEFPSIPTLWDGPFGYYWSVAMNQISGMYPTLVIVLVALQNSYCEHQFSFVDKKPDTTLPFSIRVPQSQTSAELPAPGTHTSIHLVASRDVSYADGSDTSPEAFAREEKEQTGV